MMMKLRDERNGMEGYEIRQRLVILVGLMKSK